MTRDSTKDAFDKVNFVGSDPEGSVTKLYDAANARIDVEADWYAKQASIKRWISYVTRGLAVLAFGVSAIFLDFAAFLPQVKDSNLVYSGVATVVLVVAGIVLLVDRVFIVTRGMTRFRVAEYGIRKLRIAFEGDFNRTVFANQPLTPKAFYEAKGMAADAIEEVFGIVTKETEQWQADTQAAIDALRSGIDERLGVARKRFKDARKEAEKKAKAEPPGNLNVTVRDKDGNRPRPAKLLITLEGSVTRTSPIGPGTSRGFTSLPPGDYLATISDVSGTQPSELVSKAVTVSAGKTESVSV